jgi:hypothetical protein
VEEVKVAGLAREPVKFAMRLVNCSWGRKKIIGRNMRER